MMGHMGRMEGQMHGMMADMHGMECKPAPGGKGMGPGMMGGRTGAAPK